jgi:hypothetical protein
MTEHAPRDHARLLTRVLQRMFPNHAHRLEARRILEQYGGSATEPEAERVRLAVLKLAGADIGQLRSGVLGAKEDYEDTLSWAESPSETKTRMGNRKLNPHQWAEIAAQDQKQYENWLHGHATEVI